MNKLALLKDYANYVDEKINKRELNRTNYIGVDNILPDRGGIKTSEYFSRKGKAIAFKKGDILIGNIRPYFKKIWLATFEGGCDADVLCIRPKDNISSEFLYAVLSTDFFFDYVVKGSKGSKMPRGDKNHIMQFPIMDIDNKQRIGEFVVRLNKEIANNNAISKELESMAKTIYNYWFLQFEFPDKEGKPYKSNGGKMVWNDQLKQEIPERWKVNNLYKIANFINGIACQKYRPIDDKHKLPVIKITEMHNGFTSNTEYVQDSIAEDHIINNGDILFSWSASLETMIWNRGKGGLNQHIFKVIPKDEISLHFVYQTLSTYIINFKRMAEARKTTMGHITRDHLEQSRIVIPPKDLIDKFENTVKSFYEQITIVDRESQQLKSLRDFLLPLLMNGQVTIE